MMWEFTYTDAGVPMHVLVRAAVNPDHTMDELWLQTTAFDWASTGGQLLLLSGWFNLAHSPVYNHPK